MQRDEILEKSRKEGVDEGVTNAEHRGRQFGIISFSLMYCPLALVSMIFDRTGTFGALTALYSGYMSVESYIKYKFSRNKTLLATAIISGTAAVACVAYFLLDIFYK